MKKRLFLFLLTTVLLVGVFALAVSASGSANTVAEGTCGGGLTWVFDEAGALTVSGTGYMTDFSSLSEVPWAAYRDGIRYINIAYGVETIGDYAFAGCTALEGTQITLPTGVCRIGDSAFEGCSNLTGIVFPSTLGSIYDKAFKDCVALTNITIPVSVHDIRPDVFGGCSNLTIYGYQNSRAESYATDNGIPFTAIQTDIASGTCGEGLTWVLDKTCTLVISGTGAMTNWDSYTSVPWRSYGNAIKSVVIEAGVTTIGDYAFYDGLDGTGGDYEFVIPEGVTSIGKSAFEFSGLANVYLPNTLTSIGDHAFANTNLLGVVIPASVKEFGIYPFRDCPLCVIRFSGKDTPAFDHTTVLPPADIDVWGIPGSPAESFAQNNGFNFVVLTMESGTCGENLAWKLDYAGVLTISGTGAMTNWESADAVPWYSHCEDITGITIKEGVTTIGDFAFYWFSDLASITIPNGITTIGNHAFSYCSDLTNITIPDGVTTIGASAFFGCRGLTSITIPDSVTTIGRSAFACCDGLTNIRVEEGNEYYVDIDGVLFNKQQSELICFPAARQDTAYVIPSGVTTIGESAFSHGSSLTSITIPDGVTTIGHSAFFWCNNLTGITIPDSVMAIGDYAFDACISLAVIEVEEGNAYYTDIDGVLFNKQQSELICFPAAKQDTAYVIPSGVTTIGKCAFSYCGSLTSIAIPDGVTAIGDYAFYECSSLTSIEIPNGVATIGYCTFDGCSSLTSITIPKSVTTIDGSAFDNCPNLTIYGDADSAAETYAEENSIPFVALSTTVAEGTCGEGLTWKLDEAGTLTVSGTGAMTEWASTVDVPWKVHRSSITKVVIEKGVTSIGQYSFYGGYSALTEVSIGEGVAAIGAQAFRGCSGLVTVSMPSSLSSIGAAAFRDCTSLKSISIPSNVTTIGNSAFEGCTALAAVSLPEGLTIIAYSTFSGCTSLTGITLPKELTHLGNAAFQSCTALTSITLPESLTDLGGRAFLYCENLTAMHIPAGVTWIGDFAFSECNKLTAITVAAENTAFSADENGVLFDKDKIQLLNYPDGKTDDSYTVPAGVRYIGTGAFNYCDFTTVILPDGVLRLGGLAFEQCVNLTSITIPASVTTIQDSAFSGTTNVTIRGYAGSAAQTYAADHDLPFVILKDLIAEGTCGDAMTWELGKDGTLTISGTGAMGNWNTSDRAPWYDYRSYIKKIVIAEGVASIGVDAFHDCTALTDISISGTVTSIGCTAFTNCDSLTGITIPDSVTEIGPTVFSSCNQLKVIVLPKGITAIPEGMFFGCTALETFVVPDSVTSIGDHAFCDCVGLSKITIPKTVTSISASAFMNCPKLTIHGHTGSTAETYATAKGYTFIALPTTAASGTCGDALTWKLDSVGVLTISGIGAMTDWSSGDEMPWEANRSAIKRVVIENGVTSIGAYAFHVCGVQSVSIADSVTSIGGSAFYGCNALQSITIPDSVTSIGSAAFEGCIALKSIKLSENITAIGYDTFWYCSQLTEVVIPDGVIGIRGNAFRDCTRLASVEIPASVTSIDDSAFYDCYKLTIRGYAGSAAEEYAEHYEIPFIAFVASGTCGDALVWTLDSAGVLTISGTGTIPNYSMTNMPWAAHLEEIQSVVIESGVSSIGNNAFRGCSNLTAIQLPEGLTSIGNYTFSDCSNLTAIQLPAGLTSIGTWLFNNCVNLQSITLPDSLTSIGTSAFMHCESLTALTIPAGVTEIGKWAFSECLSLPAFTVAEENTAFSVDAEGVLFDKNKTILVAYPDGKPDATYAIPEGVITVGDFAFNLCDSLTSVTLPQSLKTLASGAFEDCIGLTSMTIPAGVSEIASRAFEACLSLSAFTVEEGNTAFTVIDGVLFSADKTRLVSYPAGKSDTAYTIPSGVTTIDNNAFYQCVNLTSVVIPDSMTAIGTSVFRNCTGLASVTLPDSVTSIGSSAFLDCVNLTDIKIPANVTSIGGSAFKGCAGLTSVTIPSGVQSIGFSAFADCTALRRITIPANVTTIGNSAFAGCTALTIYGEAGSTAETYAKANSIPFAVMGTEPIEITVQIPAALGSAITAPEGGWKVGENTFSVKAESACAVVVSYDGGKTYTRLTATANTDGSYNFTASNMTADTVVAVAPIGDANGDGKITNADVGRIKAAYLGKISFDSLGQIITDANGDGKISNADVGRVKAVYLGKISLGWN